jgi:glycosyltransferase involved in cell wall biosynthesis
VANRVGANIGGYGFKHGKNILFVQSRNSEALIREISNLMKNPALCESIGKRARETVVQKLGLNRFNKELYELLDKVFLQVWGKHLN